MNVCFRMRFQVQHRVWYRIQELSNKKRKIFNVFNPSLKPSPFNFYWNQLAGFGDELNIRIRRRPQGREGIVLIGMLRIELRVDKEEYGLHACKRFGCKAWVGLTKKKKKMGIVLWHVLIDLGCLPKFFCVHLEHFDLNYLTFFFFLTLVVYINVCWCISKY